MPDIKLELLKPIDEEQFIKDNQYAFKFGAEQYFAEKEMEEQYEEEGEIISKKTIYHSIHNVGAFPYRIICDDKPVGGIIVNIKDDFGDLDLFFVNPSCHSHGIGQAAWKEIERIHSNVMVWETVTPYFEKRNLHFYINKLGFHVVEYYNEHNCTSEDMKEMFRFRKEIK